MSKVNLNNYSKEYLISIIERLGEEIDLQVDKKIKSIKKELSKHKVKRQIYLNEIAELKEAIKDRNDIIDYFYRNEKMLSFSTKIKKEKRGEYINKLKRELKNQDKIKRSINKILKDK